MTTVEIFAPAKINLTLHVTGQREDGYHLLDSLVVFADLGDRLVISETGKDSFDVTGPEAGAVPTDSSNSVWRVVSEFWLHGPLAITLEKNLPTAAGIGGGSADAAAAYRGLMALTARRENRPATSVANSERMLRFSRHGADHMVCVMSMPVRAQGVGEKLKTVAGIPPMPAVLVNPRVPIATPDVFAALTGKTNPPMPDALPAFSGVADLARWIGEQRNDLSDPAFGIAPQVATVLASLRQSGGCLVARMSGSGATCFGLYPSDGHAKDGAREIASAHPDWWVRPCVLGDQSGNVAPKVS